MNRHEKSRPIALVLCWIGSLPLALGGAAVPMVTVGDVGNPNDGSGRGGVAYEFLIGTYEVTNAEYGEFLNAVAAADPHGLYNPAMAIERSGNDGSYTYATSRGADPVAYVSWYDAVRFANWLHNGQPEGTQDATTTEDGAYAAAAPDSFGPRKAGARYFVPTENEWYKAAHHRGDGTYWTFPTQSEVAPAAALPGAGANQANYGNAVGGVTPVGSYAGAAGRYGTYDQGGNVWEWLETEIDGERGIRGGSYDDYEMLLESWYRDAEKPVFEAAFIGFRMAGAGSDPIGTPFLRGDVNQDGSLNIADAVRSLNYLFGGGTAPACLSAVDANDSGNVDIADAIALLAHLFAGTGPLAPPFTSCGADPTPDGLTCVTFSPCAQR
jgi:formylglycine-generating enzyme required for sulfatase activity